MWWNEIATLAAVVGRDPRLHRGVAPSATIEAGATLDERTGPISIGERTRICSGSTLRGPLIIGADCLIGNLSMVRGPAIIENRVRIGYAVEIKNAILEHDVSIGPMCFVADSRVDAEAYLGAQVRTSNQRLDRREIKVRQNGADVETGLDKLGCWIGAKSALGIQVIVLPGRIIPADSMFEPRITIAKNYPPGRYRSAAAIESY